VCDIPNTTLLEKKLVTLECANESHCIALKTIEATKEFSKAYYDYKVHPHAFQKGDIFLVYDQ
jgi:hypothetical protein